MSITLTYSLADQDFKRTKSVGILNLSLHLLRHLASRDDITSLTLLSNRTLALEGAISEKINVVDCDSAISGRIARIGWDQWGVYRAATRAGNEWLFLPKGFAPILLSPRFRVASYVHDTIHCFYRERYPSAMPLGELTYFHHCLRATLKHSRVIFTNSEFTRTGLEGVARREGLKTPPVVVAGIGFEDPAVPWREKRDRILLLASPWPNKRMDLAVDYLERWRQLTGYPGVIDVVGGTPDGLAKPEGDTWRWLPRLDPAEFERRMSEARALVYSSEFEGFGMPPVEAVLRGTCPVFSDIPATREVMSGSGFAFSNDDFDSFTWAMNSALRISSDRLEGWKRDLLARHHWDRVVSRVISGLEDHSSSMAIR